MTAAAIQGQPGTLADMPEPDDLESRVSALETEVGDLSQRGFRRMDGRMDEGFCQADNNFIAVRGLLDATAAGLQQITGRLDTVIEQRGEPGDRER